MAHGYQTDFQIVDVERCAPCTTQFFSKIQAKIKATIDNEDYGMSILERSRTKHIYIWLYWSNQDTLITITPFQKMRFVTKRNNVFVICTTCPEHTNIWSQHIPFSETHYSRKKKIVVDLRLPNHHHYIPKTPPTHLQRLEIPIRDNSIKRITT